MSSSLKAASNMSADTRTIASRGRASFIRIRANKASLTEYTCDFSTSGSTRQAAVLASGRHQSWLRPHDLH